MRQHRVIGFALILVFLAAPSFAIGGFGVTSIPALYPDGTSFQQLANVANVKLLVGDFNGDKRTDMALIGGSSWGSVPVAFSGGDGTFNLTNLANQQFASYAATTGAKPLVGDFNRDGMADIALIGPTQWGFVPIAFSNGDGTFTVTTVSSPLAFYSNNNYSPEALVGDFDDDGRDDIALLGPAAWASWIYVAYSDGGGNFTVSTVFTPEPNNFARMASQTNAQPLVGDFNHDNIKDLALLGTPGWGSLPVAFSNGDGSFSVANQSIQDFADYATFPGASIIAGDFNGDGKADVAVTGPSGWGSVPVAFSHGDGTFVVANQAILSFGGWAAAGTPVVGDFNNDGKTDIALKGSSLWTYIPVAFSLTPKATP
jgi:hypothetical protein